MLVTDSGPTTIQGSSAGDLVLVVGAGGGITYMLIMAATTPSASSTATTCILGDTSFSAGDDTIVAGAGNDTIVTGAGSTLVDAGTGNAFIVTNDGLGQAGDTVFLESGQNIVAANGHAGFGGDRRRRANHLCRQ